MLGGSWQPFARLEEHLSKYQRFFVRYTTEDFLQATLCGKEPNDEFQNFHVELKAITDQIMRDFRMPPEVVLKLQLEVPEEEIRDRCCLSLTL